MTSSSATSAPPGSACASAPRCHHARARLAWETRTGDGTSFATGTDIPHLDEDGRIGSVTVFLDRAPEGFTAPGQP